MGTDTLAPRRTWPEPRGHWLIGHTRHIQTEPLKHYTALWQAHGDYIHIRFMLGYSTYFLCDPSAIEHVLVKNHKNYRKPDIFNTPVSLLAGRGILTSEGDFWLRQRRLMQPVFLRNQLNRIGSPLVAAVESVASEWQRAGDGHTFDVVAAMMRLSLRVAGMTLFSSDITGDADAIGQAFRVCFSYVSDRMNGRPTLPLWMPTPGNRAFRRSKALLDRVVLDIIEARRRNREPRDDLLDLLLAAQDETSGTGMSDQQLKDEVLTLLTAGHETVGASLSWAWWLLCQHPDIQEALHDEVHARLQGRTPTLDDLPHLPLATAVFEETLRLYPPAWGQPREALAADEINGYPVPAKGLVTVSQWIVHRHPAYWSEPERFNPARFLSPQPERPKFAYFPFGGGPRVCIGNHFALLEGPLILAALAQRFRFTLVPGQTIEPDATFTLRPRSAVNVVVHKR